MAPLASPPSASPSANPSLFNTGDCTLAPVAGTTTGPLPDNFKVVVTIPESWTPTNGARSETLLLLLNAPASYSNQPTQIGLHSLLGYFATQTPEELAKGFYGPSPHATVPSVELIGDVRHCNVQGD